MDNLQKIYDAMLERDRHKRIAKILTEKIATLAKEDSRPASHVLAEATRRFECRGGRGG